MILASRSHEFSYGHRVAGHESKCANLHGHNAKVTFTIESTNGELDGVGRVVDFSVIKELLCEWLETNWDHKFLLWENDPMVLDAFPSGLLNEAYQAGRLPAAGIVLVPFNPTAENMASYLLNEIGPKVFDGYDVHLVSVEFFETSKCSVMVVLDGI
jgi:6-pyruvoyltetrahydropterin/6-carboxytetrahydropterin synthase